MKNLGNDTEVIQLSYHRSLKKLRDSTDKMEALLVELRRMTDASKFISRITEWRESHDPRRMPDDRELHSRRPSGDDEIL